MIHQFAAVNKEEKLVVKLVRLTRNDKQHEKLIFITLSTSGNVRAKSHKAVVVGERCPSLRKDSLEDTHCC
jgi:hypothetical protein